MQHLLDSSPCCLNPLPSVFNSHPRPPYVTPISGGDRSESYADGRAERRQGIGEARAELRLEQLQGSETRSLLRGEP